MIDKKWAPGEYEAEYRRLYKKAHEEILQPWEMIRYRAMRAAFEREYQIALDAMLQGLVAPE